MIYNKILIDTYSQKGLNDILISFYTQWKQRYIRTVKNSKPTLEYLYYTLDQPMSNNAVTCSEAMGYGMVIFPIMRKFDFNAKKHFLNLYNYIKSYPSVYNKNLMAWQQIEAPNGDIVNATKETSSATDGDMDISYGLLLANKLFKDKNSTYKDEALLRINALMESCVDPNDYILTLGDWVGEFKDSKFTNVTRSSDFITYSIKEFIKIDKVNNLKWQKVLLRINNIISNQMTRESKNNGLMPDFFIKENNLYVAPKTLVLESKHDGDYFFNSCRTPWRYSMDTIINHTKPSKQLLTLNNYIRKETNSIGKNIKSGYYVANGTPGTPFGITNNLSFIAPFLVSSLVEEGFDNWKLDLFKTVAKKSIDQCNFYENTLKLIALIVATGNWINPT